jgi:hypothetical protein
VSSLFPARRLEIADHGQVRFVCVVACVLLACGDNIYEMQPGELSAAYSAAVCRYWVRCGVVRDIAACGQIYEYPDSPELAAAIDAGVVTWSADVAQACIEHVDTLSCDPTDADHRVPACFGIYTGTKHDGEPCAFGTECISFECWKESIQCADACCIGVCTGDSAPLIGRIGDRCRYSACVEGYCEDSLCLPLRSEGAECTFADQCEIGLSCEGTCRRLPSHGEPCTDACRDVGDICGAISRRCEHGAWRDERCEGHFDCSPVYACSVKNTCQPLGLGESCFGQCALPLVCDFSSWSCSLPKPDGESCYFGRDCASGICSDIRTCTSEICI